MGSWRDFRAGPGLMSEEMTANHHVEKFMRVHNLDETSNLYNQCQMKIYDFCLPWTGPSIETCDKHLSFLRSNMICPSFPAQSPICHQMLDAQPFLYHFQQIVKWPFILVCTSSSGTKSGASHRKTSFHPVARRSVSWEVRIAKAMTSRLHTSQCSRSLTLNLTSSIQG